MTTKNTLSAALALGALVASTGAKAEEAPIRLEPVSPWTAEFKDESCSIQRRFAGEGQEIALELDSFGLDEFFQVTLLSSSLTPKGTPSTRFEPDDAWDEQSEARTAQFGGGYQGVIYGDSVLSQSEAEARNKASRSNGYYPALSKDVLVRREKEITGLSVKRAFDRDLFIATGALDKPMTVMRECAADLISAKGLDPAVISSLSRSPAPKDQLNWAMRTQQEYPKDVSRQGATLTLRVLVDEQGKVIDCVTRPGGHHKSFDVAACKSALKHAKFDPARDADGKPTKGYFVTTVIYSPR